MDLVPKTELMETPKDIVYTLRKKYNLEKPGRIEAALDLLEDWIKKQNHFTKKNFSRRYLETCLISSKGSIERTKQRIEKLCVLKTVLPEYFAETSVKKIAAGLEGASCWLPKLDKDNNRVFLFNNKGSPYTVENFKKIYKCSCILFEYSRVQDYCNGYIVVLDFRGCNFMEVISALSFVDLKNYLSITMDGYGFRLRGLHFIVPATTVTTAIDILLKIFKALISQKLFSRLHVHKNVEDVFEYVERDIFTSDYGGKEKITSKELTDKWVELLSCKEIQEFAAEMSQAKVDLAYRQSDKVGVEHLEMAGSFRKLCVD